MNAKPSWLKNWTWRRRGSLREWRGVHVNGREAVLYVTYKNQLGEILHLDIYGTGRNGKSAAKTYGPFLSVNNAMRKAEKMRLAPLVGPR